MTVRDQTQSDQTHLSTDLAALSAAARRLRNVLEPLASNVYFSPDVNDEFEALGFGPGVGADGCLTIAEESGCDGVTRTHPR